MSLFTLPPLPYSYDSLENVIDTETMILHHTKHHQAYINNLNKIIEEYPFLEAHSLEEISSTYFNEISEEANKILQNHGGGHFNHSFFWKCMTPNPEDSNPKIIEYSDFLKKYDFNILKIKNEMIEKGTAHFGSGWCWFIYDQINKIPKVITTSNQNTPMRQKYIPLLGIDLWEHGYYLRYKNNRKNYLEKCFEITNWKFVKNNIENIFYI